jgi:hypothetical protein
MNNEILHNLWRSDLSHSTCSACGGSAQPAVHTRSATAGGHEILYLAEVWACSICGRQWEDDTLRWRNERAAYAARAQWIANMNRAPSPLSAAGQLGPQPSFPKAHFARIRSVGSPIRAKTVANDPGTNAATVERVA